MASAASAVSSSVPRWTAACPIEFVAVNDITDAPTLAHLLKYDSVHGVWPKAGKAVDGYLEVAGKRIQVLAEKDPAKLPWKDLGVDVVLEATGKFTDRAGAAQHLAAGARNVLVSAPAKGGDLTFVIGVNDYAVRQGEAPGREHRLVHDELPGAGREGAERPRRHRAAAS